MKLSLHGVLAALAITGLAAVATAQILRLDLSQMVARTDDTVHGKIAARHVLRVDHPVDGAELYFTTLSIQGTSLETGKPLTVDVIFPGGFQDAEHGSFNSEAPSADDTKVGNEIVCFYKHTSNLGGEIAGNEIVTWHGGLYRTFQTRGETIVQGRGDGYAVPANVKLVDLARDVAALAKTKGGPR